MKKSAFYQETAKEKVPTIQLPSWLPHGIFARFGSSSDEVMIMFWIWGSWKNLMSPGFRVNVVGWFLVLALVDCEGQEIGTRPKVQDIGHGPLVGCWCQIFRWKNWIWWFDGQEVATGVVFVSSFFYRSNHFLLLPAKAQVLVREKGKKRMWTCWKNIFDVFSSLWCL